MSKPPRLICSKLISGFFKHVILKPSWATSKISYCWKHLILIMILMLELNQEDRMDPRMEKIRRRSLTQTPQAPGLMSLHTLHNQGEVKKWSWRRMIFQVGIHRDPPSTKPRAKMAKCEAAKKKENCGGLFWIFGPNTIPAHWLVLPVTLQVPPAT